MKLFFNTFYPFFFLFTLLYQADGLAKNITAGEILIIPYSKALNAHDKIKSGQTEVAAISKAEHKLILAGIDINTIPGQYLLTIQSKKEQIDSIDYFVTASNQQFLAKPPEENALQDGSLIKKKLLWSNREPKLPFSFPAQGDWENLFGFYYEDKSNDSSRKNLVKAFSKKSNDTTFEIQRIDYISLSFNKPLSVTSPSDAVCFSISFDEKLGYTVLLDHGMGLFSEISGLYNLTISEQDIVPKNSLIAKFTTDDFITSKKGKNKNISNIGDKKIQWRVFLTKSIINPTFLTKPL